MNLPILKTSTGDIAHMTDANALGAIYRQAEALVRVIIDDYDTQTQIVRRRNYALRRIGQLRAAIGENPDLDMGVKEFDASLKLSGRDILKAKSLAAMDELMWESRQGKTGRVLFEGTPAGREMEAQNQRVKDARAAADRERRAERRELYSGPRPTSVMPETLEATIERPAPQPEPAPLPKVTVTDVTPAMDPKDRAKKEIDVWLNQAAQLMSQNPFQAHNLKHIEGDDAQRVWDHLDNLITGLTTFQKRLQKEGV